MDKVIYLGQLISLNNGTEKEANRSISIACKKYWSLKNNIQRFIQHKTNGYKYLMHFNACIVTSVNMEMGSSRKQIK